MQDVCYWMTRQRDVHVSFLGRRRMLSWLRFEMASVRGCEVSVKVLFLLSGTPFSSPRAVSPEKIRGLISVVLAGC